MRNHTAPESCVILCEAKIRGATGSETLHLPPSIFLPFSNLFLNPSNHIFHAGVLAERVDELSIWIHEIEED